MKTVKQLETIKKICCILLAISTLIFSISYAYQQIDNIQRENLKFIEDQKKAKFDRNRYCYSFKDDLEKYYEGTFDQLTGAIWYNSDFNTCLFELFGSKIKDSYFNKINDVFTLEVVDSYSRLNGKEAGYSLAEWQEMVKRYMQIDDNEWDKIKIKYLELPKLPDLQF